MNCAKKEASKQLEKTRTGVGKGREALHLRRHKQGGAGDSAPATATLPPSKIRHPSQLLPGQRRIHLVEVKYCEDTRPKNQLEASKQEHRDLCRDLSRASGVGVQGPQLRAGVHTNLLGVGGVIYTPHILEPLEELGLDTHAATRLALKLHAHSVQYAYKFSSTRRALEKTRLNSRHQDQARATASNPPDPQ
eukprot:1157082-Pelagomonas_calceolata.AAC.3